MYKEPLQQEIWAQHCLTLDHKKWFRETVILDFFFFFWKILINVKCHTLGKPLHELICDWQTFQLLFWPKVLWRNPAQHSCQERTATNSIRIAVFWHSWTSRRGEERNCGRKGRKLEELQLLPRGHTDGLTLLRDPHVETQPKVWEKVYLLHRWLMLQADSSFNQESCDTPMIACKCTVSTVIQSYTNYLRSCKYHLTCHSEEVTQVIVLD